MRLVLCSDNLLLGESLAPALMARGHEVAAITTSTAACIAAVRRYQAGACLLDLRFPGSAAGLAVVREITQRHRGTAVVILAGAADPATAFEARKLGVAGFLTKDSNVAQIAQALDVVAAGGTVFERGLPGRPRVLAPRDQPVYDLTPREQEVLRRIVAGQGTGQMAHEMSIAPSTLRTYVKNLLSKLGTHSRLQAAALASREGLLAESA